MNNTIDVNKLLLELRSIWGSIGMYPAAVKSQDEEKSYEERDGFKNGWNACVMEYGGKISEAVHNAAKSLSDSEKLFLADGNYYNFCYSQENGWSVFLNDTWYYAASDAEDIPKEKYNEVANWYRKYGGAGLLYWVYLQRGYLPTIPDSRRQVEAIIELEKQDLKATKRRAFDYLTWIFQKIENKKRDYCDIARDVLDQYNKTYGPCPLNWDEVRYFVKDLMFVNRCFRFIKRLLKSVSLKIYRYLD